MSHRVYLGLGSNLGDRRLNLAAARRGLSPQVEILNASSIYETPPWGYVDQPDFLNQVLEGQTDLSPSDLLAFLKKLEAQLGRQRTFQNGPRKIDLDILLYDDLIYTQAGLEIPHPRMETRAFVLAPLAEIAPDLRHPVLNLTVRELLAGVNAAEVTIHSPD